MARTRKLKPSFFTNEDLAECSPLARLAFAGLWCVADRTGRLEDRPRRIKAEILPYDDVDVDLLLTELHEKGFIVRYEAEGVKVIYIPTFRDHQSPHPQEQNYNLPEQGEKTESHEDLRQSNETSRQCHEVSRNPNDEPTRTYIYIKDKGTRVRKEKEAAAEKEIEPPPPVDLMPGCQHFRMDLSELPETQAWYRENGYPPEAIPDVAAQVDNWLHTDTPNSVRARASQTSQHRRLRDPEFIQKGLKIYHQRHPPARSGQTPSARETKEKIEKIKNNKQKASPEKVRELLTKAGF